MSLSATNSAAAPASALTGRLAAGLSLFSLALVLLLHFIKPELGPSWRFLSEYAVGEHGWLMAVAFFTQSLACVALLLALRRHLHGVLGYLGAFFLFAAFIGLGMAAFYPMDPITIDPADATEVGKMHAIAAMIGIPSMPLSSLLLSLSLSRRSEWRGTRIALLGAAALTLCSLVAMFVIIGTQLPAAGGFGPSVIVGWPNRLLMLGYYLWLAVAGWHAARLAGR